jgi:hypothetical protein
LKLRGLLDIVADVDANLAGLSGIVESVPSANDEYLLRFGIDNYPEDTQSTLHGSRSWPRSLQTARPFCRSPAN